MFAGQAEDILAAGQLDQLGCPVAGDEHRVQPLQRGHARPRGRAHGELDPVDPRGDLSHQLDALLAAIGRLGHRAHVAERLAEGVRVERDDLRPRGQLRGELGDVLVGDGADRTERLRDDQIRLQRPQGVLVELVDRLAPLGARAHRRIDLGGGILWPTPIGSTSRVMCGRCAGLRRMVALVRDRDDLLAQIEREQQLRGVGNEAYDAHSVTVVMPVPSETASARAPHAPRPPSPACGWHRLEGLLLSR